MAKVKGHLRSDEIAERHQHGVQPGIIEAFMPIGCLLQRGGRDIAGVGPGQDRLRVGDERVDHRAGRTARRAGW